MPLKTSSSANSEGLVSLLLRNIASILNTMEALFLRLLLLDLNILLLLLGRVLSFCLGTGWILAFLFGLHLLPLPQLLCRLDGELLLEDLWMTYCGGLQLLRM